MLNRRHRTSSLSVGLGIVVVILALLGGVFFFTFVWRLPTRGRLEVWNRTQTPISIVGQELTFEVPACGHVAQDNFVLDRYDVHDDQNRFIAWQGSGGSHVAYELVTSAGAVEDAKPPADPLPTCGGAATGQ